MFTGGDLEYPKLSKIYLPHSAQAHSDRNSTPQWEGSLEEGRLSEHSPTINHEILKVVVLNTIIIWTVFIRINHFWGYRNISEGTIDSYNDKIKNDLYLYFYLQK